MRVPLLKITGNSIEVQPTEWEMNGEWILPEDWPALLLEFDYECMNCLGGLIKRLLAFYATLGMGSQAPGYNQALNVGVRWMRVLKKKAEIQAQRKAQLEAYRAWSDKQDWGFGMSQKGGLYAPFNGQIYTSKMKMLADAKALGFDAVGNDDIVKDAQRTQRHNFEVQKVVRKQRIQRVLGEVMRDVPSNTRFTMH